MEYRIDCSEIQTARDLHALLAEALSFPAYYGRNLDALYDCLCSLPHPVRLTLAGWNHDAAWAVGFEAVFADAQAENPQLQLAFEAAKI